MDGEEDVVDLDKRATRGVGVTLMVFFVDFGGGKEDDVVDGIGHESQYLIVRTIPTFYVTLRTTKSTLSPLTDFRK
jgi:hypothetical protein